MLNSLIHKFRRAGLKTSEQFLKAALAESIERENTLVDYIDKTINKVMKIP